VDWRSLGSCGAAPLGLGLSFIYVYMGCPRASPCGVSRACRCGCPAVGLLPRLVLLARKLHLPSSNESLFNLPLQPDSFFLGSTPEFHFPVARSACSGRCSCLALRSPVARMRMKQILLSLSPLLLIFLAAC